MSFTNRLLALLIAATLCAACRTAGGDRSGAVATTPAQSPAARGEAPEAAPPIVQPGAPGQASKVVGAAAATDLSKVGFTPADTKFMHGMIGHHAQAIEMVELLNTRSTNPDLKMLGLRIQVSQEDEIKMMQDWLRAR